MSSSRIGARGRRRGRLRPGCTGGGGEGSDSSADQHHGAHAVQEGAARGGPQGAACREVPGELGGLGDGRARDGRVAGGQGVQRRAEGAGVAERRSAGAAPAGRLTVVDCLTPGND
jgi:hypothetical protein